MRKTRSLRPQAFPLDGMCPSGNFLGSGEQPVLLKMKIPTEQELAGPKPHCLDTEWMLKNFLGRTKEDAIKLMKSTGGISEDFAYMSAAGLRFYLEAALEYTAAH
jgi:hypothetical protein